MPKSGVVIQSQEVLAFNNKLEKAYSQVEEYSVHLIEKDIFGKATKEFDYYFKKPSKAKTVWVTPDKGIEVSDGTSHFVYRKDTNTLFTNSIPREEAGVLDVVGALKKYIKENEASVEDVTYNNRPTYKLTIQPKNKEDGVTIYWTDKETMWPVKIDSYMGEGRCESLKEFYNTYLGIEMPGCLYSSEEFQNLQLNPGLSDEFFNIRNDIPSDAKEKKGFGGECNPLMETAKPLKEASFTVYVPGWVPERFKVNYPPEEIPVRYEEEGPDDCKVSKYYAFANVHQEIINEHYSNPIKGEFEVASIGLDVMIKEGEFTFEGSSILTQSPSVVIYGFLGNFPKDNLVESKKVNINGVEATLNKYKEVFPNRMSTRLSNGTTETFDYGNATTYHNFLFWKANDLYFVLSTPHEEALKGGCSTAINIETNQPSQRCTEDVPIGATLTDEEMIKIASSLEPLKNACGDTNGDGVLNQTDLDAITSYAFGGVEIPANVNADLNGDGVVDIRDVNIMTDHVKRNKPKPTCEQSAIAKTYECGDVNQDGAINKNDVTKITDYVFNGVPIPNIKLVDMNGDNVTDILDVTLLTNYVYRNGTKPSCSPQNLEQGKSHTATLNACGNNNRDLVIDKGDVNQLVEYVFKGGILAPGVGMDQIDLNADGVVDILDVTILTNYVYRNGSAPTC